ncbi:MAG: PorT family protein [Cytophagales bacterium]|nr:PorT family protein [Cytophaga sp.]
MQLFFRIILVVIVFTVISIQHGYSQISLGVGITPGLGYLRSSQLKQMGPVIEEQDNAQLCDYKTRAAFQLGFHAVVQYRLTHQINIVAMPGINIFQSTYNSTFTKNESLGGDDYIEHRIVSIAKFKGTQFQIPIFAKYYLIPDKPYFATAGLNFSYNSKMKMYSEEDSITTSFIGSGLGASSKKDYDYSNIKIDGYKPFQMHMILGIGTSILTGYRRNLDIELSYYIPLTSSPYYTTDAAYSAQALNNKVFTQDGKESLEKSTGKNLNHYRMHMINLTVRYLIFTRVK